MVQRNIDNKGGGGGRMENTSLARRRSVLVVLKVKYYSQRLARRHGEIGPRDLLQGTVTRALPLQDAPVRT